MSVGVDEGDLDKIVLADGVGDVVVFGDDGAVGDVYDVFVVFADASVLGDVYVVVVDEGVVVVDVVDGVVDDDVNMDVVVVGDLLCDEVEEGHRAGGEVLAAVTRHLNSTFIF